MRAMKFLMLFLWTLMMSRSVPPAESARILISAMFGSGSHYTSMLPVGKSLVERGHNVTFLISEENAERGEMNREHASLFNYDVYSYPGQDHRKVTLVNELFNMNYYNNASALQMLHFLSEFPKFNVMACDAILADRALLERLKDTEAIIFDIIWPCAVYMHSYIQRHLGGRDVPFIASSMTTPLTQAFYMAGAPFHPSYQPVMQTGYTSTMIFSERVANTISEWISWARWTNIMTTSFTDLVDKYDLDPNLKIDLTLSKTIDLYLANMDFSVEVPAALPPGMIPVGGLSTGPARPLADQDLEVFMQSSGDDGVIIISFGSYCDTVISSKSEIINMFLETFRRVPQKVIMQLKDYPQENLPENVRTMSWFPQNDFLGHPKTRLFIYHGGNNGLYEAIYHAVPILVLPIAADQMDTAARIEERGIGVRLPWHSVSQETIFARVTEVLQNPSYANNARRLSAIYRDRQMRPADTAAFWVDHVIRHGGEYFRSPVNDLTFIQRNLLDVYLTLVLFIGGILYFVFVCLRLCLRRIW